MRTLVFASLLVMVGCSANLKENQPGDPVGVYALSADADMTSTCTELLNATPRPWKFDVTLRKSGTKGYWFSGAQPIEGTFDGTSLTFKQSMTVAVRDADKARELGPCAVVRTDEFTGTMSNGVASFAGTLRYSYQVAPGADCRDIVGSSGEPANPNLPHFATLPCDLRLAVTATRTGDPK